MSVDTFVAAGGAVHLLLHLDLHQIGVVLGQQLVSDIQQSQRASEHMDIEASPQSRWATACTNDSIMFIHTIRSQTDGYHQNDDHFTGGSATIEAALQSPGHSRGCVITTYLFCDRTYDWSYCSH